MLKRQWINDLKRKAKIGNREEQSLVIEFRERKIIMNKTLLRGNLGKERITSMNFRKSSSWKKKALIGGVILALKGTFPHLARASSSEEINDPSSSSYGIKIDEVEQLIKCANQGYAASQYLLGMRYLKGDGVIEDLNEALKWLRKAAAQGYAPSHYQLGLMYEVGAGVPQNAHEAIRRYRLAAELEHPDAQFRLGRSLLKYGAETEENLREALEWLRKAAELGHKASQYFLERWSVEK